MKTIWYILSKQNSGKLPLTRANKTEINTLVQEISILGGVAYKPACVLCSLSAVYLMARFEGLGTSTLKMPD